MKLPSFARGGLFLVFLFALSFACFAAEPEPAPGGGGRRVIKSTGKSPTGASSSSSGGQYGSRGPTITADPLVVNPPSTQENGWTKLSWYAGGGHANTEVLVSVDGGSPTLVAKGGKGGREVTVQPGKTYRYILSDAGQELASVTVTAKPRTTPFGKEGGASTASTSTGAQYVPAGPSITASPELVPISNTQGTGWSKLNWYAGSGHANAEVQVSVDGQSPTPVASARRGKGSQTVTVEPGKSYRYILTDAGQELAAVTVTGKPRTAPTKP